MIAAALALLLAGGYTLADAYDAVPGPLTLRPEVPRPQPYPQVSALPAPLPTVLPDGAAPKARDVTALVASLGQQRELGPAVSVEVLDGSDGRRIASLRPSQAGPPASSTKVLTAVAALRTLGPASTLPTRAVLHGDRVVLVGGGDLLLTTGPAKPGVIGRASLTDLAAQAARRLQQLGRTSVQLGYDRSLFEGSGGADWVEADYRWVIPMSPMAMLQATAAGRLPAGVDYARETAQAFAAELQANGITVQGDPLSQTLPAGATPLGVVHSATVAELVSFMLKESDNSVTEALGRLVSLKRGGGSTTAAGAQAVVATLTELGLPTAGLSLRDSCGLSSGNLVTAELLARLVDRALRGKDPDLVSLLGSLPVSHLDGTLRNRQGPAAGLVRAKTGTLPKVVSLTGIVQARSGATYVFSIVAARLASVEEARARVDEFVARLAAEG